MDKQTEQILMIHALMTVKAKRMPKQEAFESAVAMFAKIAIQGTNYATLQDIEDAYCAMQILVKDFPDHFGAMAAAATLALQEAKRGKA
jgi:hypothetical protein